MSGVPVYCAYTHELDLDTIKPNPRNPNRHPDAQIDLLATIIKKQGWRNPIVISTLSNLVVKGHGRLMAAQQLKLKTVPVDYQHYDTPQHEYADLIADNRIAEFSDMATETLSALVAEMSKAKFDLTLTALTSDELAQLLGTATPGAATPFVAERWAVIIECDKEVDQKELIEEFTERGLKCRSLIS